MALADDPALLDPPLGFAVNVTKAGGHDEAEALRRLPGLLQFARTFAAVLLEQAFDTPVAGFPLPARTIAADLATKLDAGPNPTAALLVRAIVDVCDLMTDRDETYVDGDQDADLDKIVAVIQQLLDRFAGWVDAASLPRLAAEAQRARTEFDRAAAKLDLRA